MHAEDGLVLSGEGGLPPVLADRRGTDRERRIVLAGALPQAAQALGDKCAQVRERGLVVVEGGGEAVEHARVEAEAGGNAESVGEAGQRGGFRADLLRIA